MSALPPPPAPALQWALFLDVDGTVLDFATTPAGVNVDPALLQALLTLHEVLGGALALVSGRSLAQLDALFAPLHLPAAGLHGLQMRGASDTSTHRVAPSDELARVRGAAQALAAKYPGALVEDKGMTLALHWRGAPAAEEPLHEFATSALIDLPGYHVQPGSHVFELRPDGAHKGHAIVELMADPPFAGRRPVFIGDDLTDEHGFAEVNARDGISVLVGSRHASLARHGLRDPGTVRDWLRAAAVALSAARTTPPTHEGTPST